MLTNIAFRKLENGWPVKYHIRLADGSVEEKGTSREKYVETKAEIVSLVATLVDDHLERT